MDRILVEQWLNNLKEYWFNKNVEKASLLFKKTTFYQETPFDDPYTTFAEIKKEWEHIKTQDIKEIKFKILAIENKTVIVEWIFKRYISEFNGIYEIKFNDDNECIYFKNWEMKKNNHKTMKVITVCGSLKFLKEMMEVTEKMELSGNCMLVPIYNPNKPSKDDFTEEEALMLDKMHKERIKLADAILVVNVDNYIGSSTKSEIEYAKKLNKEIIYYTDVINK